MARRVYDFEDPDRFVAGTIGEPGNRTFYLQAREGSRIASVLIEKVQVELLANRLRQLLVEVRARGASVPEDPADADLDTAPMDEPMNEVFRVGTMAIIWDGDDDSVVVEAREMTVEDEADSAEDEAEIDDAEEEGDASSDVVRVHLQPGKALAFAKQALAIVAAGRPPCPFCGQPLNPEGHICARRNGFMH
jgi:uncharacterized repeat protein (TIGR03847 family)